MKIVTEKSRLLYSIVGLSSFEPQTVSLLADLFTPTPTQRVWTKSLSYIAIKENDPATASTKLSRKNKRNNTENNIIPITNYLDAIEYNISVYNDK